ncbi:MAG TPA: DUF169 domain-containing protein [Blastocatellia bacterium]|nr:DUF169 domain-containing protein [Blastocatellia bacterium]
MSNTSRVKDILRLSKSPIAIGFFDVAPNNLKQWSAGQVPAGCTFWQKAMDGESFYTVPSDHYNCAVGSYTHKIDLPPDRGNQLEQTVGFMVESGYLSMSEVPGIPTLNKTPNFIAYAPADKAEFKPDVVIVAANPAQAMLLYEAALKAGAGNALTNVLGRPGCAVLPLTMSTGRASLSFGCKGNRTFTGLPDEEMYVCVTGDKWPAVADKIIEAYEANAKMEKHYLEHKAQFAQV